MKKGHITLFTAIAAAAAFASSAQAAVLSDGHTGDYRIIFVTLGDTLAQDTGIAFYNSFVSTQAGLAGSTQTKDLATTWTAVGSTLLTSAKVNTGTDSGGADIHIYTPSATLGTYTLVATSYTDLWDSSIATGVRYGDGTVSSQATGGGGDQIWTGTNSNGSTATGGDGQYLGSGDNGDNLPPSRYIRGTRGGLTDGNWISGISDHDLQTKNMMAMSGVITEAVPEPSSMSLLALGGLALLRRRRA